MITTDPASINLRMRRALRGDGAEGSIIEMRDGDWEVTRNPNRAIAALIRWEDGQQSQVPLRQDYGKAVEL